MAVYETIFGQKLSPAWLNQILGGEDGEARERDILHVSELSGLVGYVSANIEACLGRK